MVVPYIDQKRLQDLHTLLREMCNNLERREMVQSQLEKPLRENDPDLLQYLDSLTPLPITKPIPIHFYEYYAIHCAAGTLPAVHPMVMQQVTQEYVRAPDAAEKRVAMLGQMRKENELLAQYVMFTLPTILQPDEPFPGLSLKESEEKVQVYAKIESVILYAMIDRQLRRGQN